MSITTLCAICEALDISADWVLRCGTPAEKAAMLRLLLDLKELLRASNRAPAFLNERGP